MKFLLLAALLAFSSSALAVPASLFVTHACVIWDWQMSAAPGVQRTIKLARDAGIPNFYLVHGDPEELDKALEKPGCEYYLRYPGPTRYARSLGGEHTIRPPYPDNILTGGYFTQCLAFTAADLIRGFEWIPKRELRLHYVMDAVYHLPARTGSTLLNAIEDLRPISNEKFFEIVKYGVQGPLAFAARKQFLSEEWEPYYTAVIQRDGRYIETIGHGPRKVVMNFITTEELPALLR